MGIALARLAGAWLKKRRLVLAKRGEGAKNRVIAQKAIKHKDKSKRLGRRRVIGSEKATQTGIKIFLLFIPDAQRHVYPYVSPTYGCQGKFCPLMRDQ